MHECSQTQGMTIFEHGIMVGDFFTDLHSHIVYGDALKFEWNLPKGFAEWYRNSSNQFESLETMQTYAIYHDCGKPFCLEIDEEGKRHFPNHAQVSYDTWIRETNDEKIGWYILHDMDFHALRGDCLDETLKDPRSIDLLLMAYSEIHANASMFGGIDSTSFKIKKKKLDKIFNKIASTDYSNQ